MGHPHTIAHLEINNDETFINITTIIIPKKSKAIDMRFFWLREQENQQQFKLHWCKGIDNVADYFTKHHTTPHHIKMRKICLSSCLLGNYNIEEYDNLRHVFPLHARVC